MLNWKNFSSWKTGIIALLLVIDIMLLISSVCGALFLTKNKNIKDIEHFKVKKALDFGLFYFRVSLKIDKTIENLSKMNKFEQENIN
ncbi:hypothetical protein [Spiroplasma tabanidicola]|uniref:Uncharacterized protein n=1 Tax=Spiroplasma tabanidicola TaxID=324079 RepID=A0A6I6C8J8_9MOLU|nr:hypothetical protein [Spiroplasma tabanidicola]QGS51996.1 hypothetical protein STABA_v1c06350 [Spiroplasma tabanidicola]